MEIAHEICIVLENQEDILFKSLNIENIFRIVCSTLSKNKILMSLAWKAHS